MEITEAIKILKDHNKWRIGTFEEIKMADPRELTQAIDIVIAFAEKHQSLQLLQPDVIKSVCVHEYITDANWQTQTCRKCNDRIILDQTVL